MKILFVIPFLAKDFVSLESYREGVVPLSGSQGSALLIADALASRGHTVGLWVQGGQKATDTLVQSFSSLEGALSSSWDRIVLASWEDEDTFAALASAGISPLLWTHVDVPRGTLLRLEEGLLCGIIVVSDATRLPLLHSSHRRQISRVYNPLNPHFVPPPVSSIERYASRTVIFAGHFSENKGAHLVLRIWPEVRRMINNAKLIMAGSTQLYRKGTATGELGLSTPTFEKQYIQPIIREFGSLEKAGIQVTGLLTPRQLRELYGSAALGFINFNWREYTETFCCVGAEMLATALPVFSFAAGALPETMGRTGGAVLCRKRDLHAGADLVGRLLGDAERLSQLGATGRQSVVREYSLSKLCDIWEGLLASRPAELSCHAGSWQSRLGIRYCVEHAVGLLGLGRVYRKVLYAVNRGVQ